MLRSRRKKEMYPSPPLAVSYTNMSVWSRVSTALLTLKAQSWLLWAVTEKGESIHKGFLRTYLLFLLFFSNPFHAEHFNWPSLWRVKRVSGRWNWKLPRKNSCEEKKTTVLEVKEVLFITLYPVKYVASIHADKCRRSSPFSGTESSLSILSFI